VRPSSNLQACLFALPRLCAGDWPERERSGSPRYRPMTERASSSILAPILEGLESLQRIASTPGGLPNQGHPGFVWIVTPGA
jgi:hypothetical protein